MVHIKSFHDMSQTQCMRTINEDLQKPILKILAQHGLLRVPAVQYFLKHEHQIETDEGNVRTSLRSYERNNLVKQIQLEKEFSYHLVYCLPEDVDRRPDLPVFDNYEHAFIDLYLRYQGIRQHPELATAPEQYLIALFTPHASTNKEDA